MNLQSLELTEEELQLAKEQVQRTAYLKWQNAVCPPGDPISFWKEAELEWIQYEYVPDRALIIREHSAS